MPENGPVSDVRHVLVLPDRDAAEEAAQALGERFGIDEEPRLVRDALAGEDDAEDAQWLVVLRDEGERLDPAELDAFAGSGTAGARSPDPEPSSGTAPGPLRVAEPVGCQCRVGCCKRWPGRLRMTTLSPR